MSIFSKINRIVALRNGIRNRLVTFGLANASTKLEGCKTALEGMTDNTKKTTTSNPIRGTFSSGATQKIFGRTGEGYCNSSSLIEISVTNLVAPNIKNGVNVGGVIGSYEGVYPNSGVLTINKQMSYKITVKDKTGQIYASINGQEDYFKTFTVNFSGPAIYIECNYDGIIVNSGAVGINTRGSCFILATNNSPSITVLDV